MLRTVCESQTFQFGHKTRIVKMFLSQFEVGMNQKWMLIKFIESKCG